MTIIIILLFCLDFVSVVNVFSYFSIFHFVLKELMITCFHHFSFWNLSSVLYFWVTMIQSKGPIYVKIWANLSKLFLNWIVVCLVMIFFWSPSCCPVPIVCFSHNTCSVVHLFADELVHEKEKYKFICDDLDMTFTELIGN